MSCHYCGGRGTALSEHFSWCAIAIAERDVQRLKLSSIEPSDDGESASRTEPSRIEDKSRHPLPARPADKLFRRIEELDANTLRELLTALTFATINGARFVQGAFHLPVMGNIPAGLSVMIQEGKLIGVVSLPDGTPPVSRTQSV